LEIAVPSSRYLWFFLVSVFLLSFFFFFPLLLPFCLFRSSPADLPHEIFPCGSPSSVVFIFFCYLVSVVPFRSLPLYLFPLVTPRPNFPLLFQNRLSLPSFDENLSYFGLPLKNRLLRQSFFPPFFPVALFAYLLRLHPRPSCFFIFFTS